MGSTEGSANFEVILDLSILASGLSGEVVLGSVSTLNLDVDIGQVLNRKRFTLGSVEESKSLISSSVEVRCEVLLTDGFILVVERLQEAVVFRVGIELHGVLVVGEKSVVSVSDISQIASLIENKM